MTSATVLLPNRITTPPIPPSNSNTSQRYNSSNTTTPIRNVSSWKSTSSNAQTSKREVDYYLNPTELFRWINYRRWDGAKARAESHPEEVSTWIVSRNTKNESDDVGRSGNRVLWRHLPLHLVCMQVGNVSGTTPTNVGTGAANNSSPLSQVESLVDVLISIYPDGVSQPDDQGMLPIHQAVANGASERIINLLLLSHPASVNVRDKYNRTPMDIINEIPASSRRDATRMALHRASEKINALASAVRNESADDIAKVQLSAANERVASQRIIMRMEDEVKDANKTIEELKEECGARQQSEITYQEEIRMLKEQLESKNNECSTLQEERAEMKISLDNANMTIRNHDKVVSEIKNTANVESNAHADQISSLKSEVATSKAMSDALEEQLRSRFAQEEYLNNLVVELENKVHTSTEQLSKTIKQHEEEKEAMTKEREHFEKNMDDITKRNVSYQNRIGELNKQVSSLLASQASFQAEHDRLIEASTRYENDLLEAINSERERLHRSIKKQKQFFDTVVGEQEVIMDDAVKKEKDIRFDYGQERERSLLAVEQLHTQFKTLHAAERERKLKQNTNTDIYKSSSSSSVANVGEWHDDCDHASSVQNSSDRNRDRIDNYNSASADERNGDRVGHSSINSVAATTTTSDNLRKSPSTDIVSNVSNTRNIFNCAAQQDEPVTVTPPSSFQSKKPQSPVFTLPSKTQISRQSSLSPPAAKTPHHPSHSASEQKDQHGYQSPHSVIQPIPHQPATTSSRNKSPQPPPPLHYKTSAFNQPHYPKSHSSVQSSSYQQSQSSYQQEYHQTTQPVKTPSRSLIVKHPVVEESSSIEKGFEVMHIREETPPFEMATPPSAIRRQANNDFHFSNTSRKVPSATTTSSSNNYNNPFNTQDDDDDSDDDVDNTPGPVRSGQLLRFLEDRAEHEQKFKNDISPSNASSNSNNSNAYHTRSNDHQFYNARHKSSSPSANMRSIALADNTDEYSQATSSDGDTSSPSSVTGYAYRTTTSRTRNTVIKTTSSMASGNRDNINNIHIGAATTSTITGADIGEF